MLTSLFSSPVLNLLYQTDLFTKILLLMLMLLSLATLTLGLYKSMELWREHKELSRLITRLRTVQTLYEYKSISSSYTGNYGKLFQLLIKESGQLSFRDFLRQDQKELFLTKSDHHVQDTLLLYQAGTGFLGTSGAISPYWSFWNGLGTYTFFSNY